MRTKTLIIEITVIITAIIAMLGLALITGPGCSKKITDIDEENVSVPELAKDITPT